MGKNVDPRENQLMNTYIMGTLDQQNYFVKRKSMVKKMRQNVKSMLE